MFVVYCVAVVCRSLSAVVVCCLIVRNLLCVVCGDVVCKVFCVVRCSVLAVVVVRCVLFDDWRLVAAVCYVLFDDVCWCNAGCSLDVVCCLLCVVRKLLLDVDCVLLVGCRLLFVVVCRCCFFGGRGACFLLCVVQ